MKIAIFGQVYKTDTIVYSKKLIALLHSKSIEVVVYQEVQTQLKAEDIHTDFSTFSSYETLDKDVDYMISVGGDGTMLRAANIILDRDIPIIGINTGRLGFLASIHKENMEKAVNQLISGEYQIINRSILEVTTENSNSIFEKSYALNEVSISRNKSTSMITIDTFVDNTFLNSYWSDGLIIATPTGSTGYSLSCNGPIITPLANVIAITPIAPHNLSIRPLIIRDDAQIKLKISSREKDFLVSLDGRVQTVAISQKVFVKKANFQLQMIVLKDQYFFKTLREKLLWGKDTRN